MPISKSEFYDILRDYASSEFKDIPQEDSDIDYEFSPGFKRKMKSLFNETDKHTPAQRRRPYKTIIAIVAAVLILLASLMSVSASKMPIVYFFTEKNKTFLDFFFSGNISKTIEYEYSFSKLPKGFSEAMSEVNEYSVHKAYKNKKGDLIVFNQETTEDLAYSIYNEKGKGKIKTIFLDETEVLIYKRNDENLWIANWCYDTYFFSITYYGCTSQDELVKVIKLIS